MAGLQRGDLHVVFQAFVDAPAHGLHDPHAPVGLCRPAQISHIPRGKEVEFIRGARLGRILPVSGSAEEKQPGGNEVFQR